MKITITVKTNSRREEVTVREDGTIHVAVNAPPVEGKANDRIVKLLAEHLGKPKSRIAIVGGFKSKTKIVEIQ